MLKFIEKIKEKRQIKEHERKMILKRIEDVKEEEEKKRDEEKKERFLNSLTFTGKFEKLSEQEAKIFKKYAEETIKYWEERISNEKKEYSGKDILTAPDGVYRVILKHKDYKKKGDHITGCYDFFEKQGDSFWIFGCEEPICFNEFSYTDDEELFNEIKKIVLIERRLKCKK